MVRVVMNEHVGAGDGSGVGDILQSLDCAPVVAVRKVGSKHEMKSLVDAYFVLHSLKRRCRSCEVSLDDSLYLRRHLVQVTADISRMFLDAWQESPHRKRNPVARRVQQGVASLVRQHERRANQK